MEYVLPDLHIINVTLTIVKEFLELVSSAIILSGCLYSLYYYIYYSLHKDFDNELVFKNFRTKTSRCIIVGLDFLIAADVIYSTVDQQLNQILELAIIVVIRTVISFFLNKELNLKENIKQ